MAASTPGAKSWSRTKPPSRARLVSAGSAIAVALTGDRAETLAGTGASWQSLPVLPRARATTVALPASGTTDALAADGSTLTVWNNTAGSARWVKAQVISVPIQYGSSS